MIRATDKIMPQEARLRQGAWLFLAMLAVFFLSCMILFLLYALTRSKSADLPIAPLEIPFSFIATTFLLVGISGALHLAVQSARHEQQLALRRYVSLAFIQSMLFLLVQSFGMAWLAVVHFKIDKPEETLYGLTFFLALVHALHVVGGVVAMVFVMVKVWRHMYDHENYWGVVYCAWYWHFLDIVWLLMLISFGLAAGLN
jgi:cytochrome c oxidase subunit 3